MLNDDGSVQGWINGGPAGAGYLWLPKGTVMKGVGTAASRIPFADLDGGGREDYIDVNPATGATRAWANAG